MVNKFINCHKGTTVVFQDPVSKIKIKAGGINKGVIINPKDTVLSLTDSFLPNFKVDGFVPKNIKVQPTIYIGWPDMDIPNLSIEDWEILIKELRMLNNDVTVFCVGGHGRTGSALAILAVLMGLPTRSPIQFVRDKYCHSAVETSEQVLYINRITKTKNLEVLREIKEIEYYLEEQRRQMEKDFKNTDKYI